MMHDRSAWLRGTPGPKIIKGREYKNLVEFSRKCQTCEKPFSIFVTPKIAAGHADSNSFGLKNCPEHRRNRTAGDAAETERLRMENNVMREELAGLYERDKSQFAEIQVLKGRLAQYELQDAATVQILERREQLWDTRAAPPLTFPWVMG